MEIPAIIIIGFKECGKKTLVERIIQLTSSVSSGKKVAVIIDSETGKLPESILSLSGAKISQEDSVAEHENAIYTTLFDESVETLLNEKKTAPASNISGFVFVNHAFESTMFLDIMNINEGALSVIFNNINLKNIIDVVDGSKFLDDLKSPDTLGIRYPDSFKFEDEEEEEEEEDDCCKDGKCTKKEQEEDCCKDGKCTKKEQVEEDCCKDGKCAKEEGQKDCCDEDGCCDGDDEDDDEADFIAKKDEYVHSLLLDQIGSSINVFISKTDLVDVKDVDFIEKLIKLQAPGIKVVRGGNKFANITLKDLFPQDEPIDVPDYAEVNETYKGVSIDRYMKRAPFHPERLYNFLFQDGDVDTLNEQTVKGLLQVSGDVWLATNMKNYYKFALSPDGITFEDGQPFFGSIEEKDWPQDENIIKCIKKDIGLNTYQDRKNDITFLGVEPLGFDSATFKKRLIDCLLTEDEMKLGPNEWAEYKDPLKPFIQTLKELNLDDVDFEDEEDDEEDQE